METKSKKNHDEKWQQAFAEATQTWKRALELIKNAPNQSMQIITISQKAADQFAKIQGYISFVKIYIQLATYHVSTRHDPTAAAECYTIAAKQVTTHNLLCNLKIRQSLLSLATKIAVAFEKQYNLDNLHGKIFLEKAIEYYGMALMLRRIAVEDKAISRYLFFKKAGCYAKKSVNLSNLYFGQDISQKSEKEKQTIKSLEKEAEAANRNACDSYKNAANNGCPLAKFKLSLCYIIGNGRTYGITPEQGYYYLCEAAAANVREAQYMLGKLLLTNRNFHGYAVNADPYTAMLHLRDYLEFQLQNPRHDPSILAEIAELILRASRLLQKNNADAKVGNRLKEALKPSKKDFLKITNSVNEIIQHYNPLKEEKKQLLSQNKSNIYNKKKSKQKSNKLTGEQNNNTSNQETNNSESADAKQVPKHCIINDDSVSKPPVPAYVTGEINPRQFHQNHATAIGTKKSSNLGRRSAKSYHDISSTLKENNSTNTPNVPNISLQELHHIINGTQECTLTLVEKIADEKDESSFLNIRMISQAAWNLLAIQIQLPKLPSNLVHRLSDWYVKLSRSINKLSSKITPLQITDQKTPSDSGVATEEEKEAQTEQLLLQTAVVKLQNNANALHTALNPKPRRG